MVHIGKEIKKRAQEQRIGPTELAKMISVSKQNVYHIFERKSIDSDQLQKISTALNFNFFELYNVHEHDQNAQVNSDKVILEQVQKIRDLEATVRVLTRALEDLRVLSGFSPDDNITQETTAKTQKKSIADEVYGPDKKLSFTGLGDSSLDEFLSEKKPPTADQVILEERARVAKKEAERKRKGGADLDMSSMKSKV